MAGFREFATGEVLTSANVNDFLMKQSVMVFVDAAARTAALGAEVAEGMLTYNLDTDQLEVFDGAAFVSVASPPTPPTTSASDLTSGTLAEARMASGTVVQVVRSFSDTTSFHNLAPGTRTGNIPGLTVGITPKFNNSRVLLFLYVVTSRSGPCFFFRNGTEIQTPPAAGSRQRGYFRFAEASVFIEDAPATTALCTYTVRMAHNDSGSTREIFVNSSRNDDFNDFRTTRGRANLVAYEIKV